MRKIWDLPGGIHPQEHKRQSLGHAIGTVPLPAQLTIPLSQHIGAPASPIVAIGDKVLKGQMIAQAKGFVSSAVHAPTSGTVSAIENQPIPHSSGMTAPCIQIDTDGQDQWLEHQGISNYQQTAPSELLDIIRNAGIAGMGGAGFPTAVKLAPKEPIDTLIINATECEPYITADDALIREKPEEIIEGIKILAHILGEPKNIIIGIEDNKPEAYAALEKHLANTHIELVDFHTKYPSGGEKQLIYTLTGKEVPSGGLPAQLGIVCQNIGTAQAIYRAVVHGEPLISRVTTLTGDALKTQQNFFTLIGTPVGHLLDFCGFNADQCSRLIMGGPMMGFTLLDTSVPVVKTTNCILAPSHSELPAPPLAQACIRCGMCAEACPVSLLPQQMLWYAQSQNYERLEAHNLFDCIECGACSYVCPSAIPLVQYYRASKGEIRELQKQKIKSDKARERFEFNKARKEREAAEKLAKREARKKAAEQKAAKGATQTTDDLVKAAMERASQRQASPDEQRPRLERAIASAENRLSLAETKLTELEKQGTEEQLDVARAKREDAKRRLQDAQQRLKELNKTTDRVTEKMQASPKKLLEDKLQSIDQRIATTEQKIAETEDETIKAALTKGLEKQQKKRIEVQQQLTESSDTPAPEPAQQETDAASLAIARAQAKAEAMASMSEEDKLKNSISSLEKRIEKAQLKLTAAEQEGSDHIDALRTGLEKMQTKLADNQSQLTALTQSPAE